MIIFSAYDVKMPIFPKMKTKNWIKRIAGNYNKTIGDIAYIFFTERKILEMNKQYLKHNYTTDILTFDYTEKNRLSGDLFISIDTVQSNAKRFLTNFEIELYRVMIHGILHLCGINDNTPSQRKIMNEYENNALNSLYNTVTPVSEQQNCYS